jgi:hypothetical protein
MIDNEALLKTPINELTRDQVTQAFIALEDKFQRIAEENKLFKPSNVKTKVYVQSDYIESGSIKSMADGKIYDSKSKYYQSVKDAGCVIVGNEKQQANKGVNELTQRDVKNAIERLRSR